MTAFEEFGVLSEIAKAIEELDWILPTDIQAESIPLILGGGDVLMAAETGSGKTAAFCLPIIQIVWETLKDLESGKVENASQNMSPPWVMSTLDRSSALAVSPDGLRTQSREQNSWHGVRCTRGLCSGKWGFEATVGDEGICRVGWSSLQANLELGTCSLGFGFGGTGKKSNKKKYDNYGEPFGKNDVITCLIDLDEGEIKFLKNGVDLGTAFNLNMKVENDAFFPAVVLKNSEMSFNFGNKPFKYTLPNGYLPVNAASGNQFVRNTNGDKVTSIKISTNAPQAIIIEPSRELAEQTYTQIKNFKKYLESPKIRELLLTGGININDQIATLQEGVHIIIGTPGRLEDLIQGGYLSLESCRFFVLDEADGLLKGDYTELIERLHGQMPKITSDGRRLQMIVCSATLHAFEVKKMAVKLMHFPTWVDLKGEDTVPETIHHVVVNVDPQTDRSWINLRRHIDTDGVHAKDDIKSGESSPEALSEAVKLLKGEYVVRAIDEHQMDKAIIFCRTKSDCDNLEKYLKSLDFNKYTCVCLHGDRKPYERKANLETFKQGNVKFLICTEVAARGLDILGLPFMINVTLPDVKENYVHRIGRVGRAERMGLAISLVSTVPEKVWYHGHWCKRGAKHCGNTNLTDQRGCCIWYNESGYLGEIEEHLNITIQQIESNIKVPCNEFDGKVVYGQMKQQSCSTYENHTAQMAPAVKELSKLESDAQLIYLKRHLTTEALLFQDDVDIKIEPPSPPQLTETDPITTLLFKNETDMDVEPPPPPQLTWIDPTAALIKNECDMDIEPPPPPQLSFTAPTTTLLIKTETVNNIQPPPPPQIKQTAPTAIPPDAVVHVIPRKKRKQHRHRHLRKGGLGRRGKLQLSGQIQLDSDEQSRFLDWICPKAYCGYSNYSWREQCIRCNNDKPRGHHGAQNGKDSYHGNKFGGSGGGSGGSRRGSRGARGSSYRGGGRGYTPGRLG